MSHPRCGRTALGLLSVIALGASVLSVTSGAAQAAPPAAELPAVSPAPQDIARVGGDVAVPGRAAVVVDGTTDAAARELLVDELREHGVDRVDVLAPGESGSGSVPLTVRLGAADREDIATGLSGTEVPDHAEGYALRVAAPNLGSGDVAIGGTDAAGQYYGVQTLTQLFTATGDGDWRIAGAGVSDWPAMPLRGAIEGFYGEPWSQAERLDQLGFYGDVKANTYIYAPKDDPYHREKWREPYPADKLAELTELVEEADRHHVRFTFALSPGNTVCYSGEEDFQALTAKLQSMYDAGVRAFSVPLDDINTGRWHCDSDQETFGSPSGNAAGAAQVHLLNRVQREFIETHEGAYPLQMVPTEYYNTVNTSYKTQLRENLDTDVVMMWTGEGVVPVSVTVEQAKQAAEVFGGPTFLWDNYPVNDFGNTSGRLLLAPYAHREAGLSDHLAGIVSNPMNQAAASKVAVFGFADFSWNDRAYDPERNWREAMRYLSGDDPGATEALLVFGDLNHMAPTFGSEPWQPQAPVLAARIERFWSDWKAGDRAGAVDELRTYVDAIANAPETIRGGSVGDAFVSDAAPWLDATDLWGASAQKMTDAFAARLDGRGQEASDLAAESEELMTRAQAVVVDPPDNSWGKARVRIADGVLDTFLTDAADMLRNPIVASTPDRVVYSGDGTAPLPVEVTNRIAGPVTDVSVGLDAGDAGVTPERVDLGAMDTGDARTADFELAWPQQRAGTVSATTSLSWNEGEARTTEATRDLQVTCADTPTRPTAVTYVDSEETAGEDGAAANAIDGDPSTIWHTEWSAGNAPYPHELQLDLGSTRDVCALRYLPRSDGGNGTVADFEVYLSQDGSTWGEPVAAGTWPGGADEQWVGFAETSARYVRFVARSEQNGNPWTSAAEISVDAR
ncbi:MAG: beta-N-acetylglucosaminidase domain-containing protein [Nocardioides sp.]|uniref:beta-N-acetylglucosaminidase domain-containing protein n=1 Tax=Nocardioides sp. TaxID=35761 RepID=UPI003D6B72CE